MNRFLIFLILFLLWFNNVAISQENYPYGAITGMQWKTFDTKASDVLNAINNAYGNKMVFSDNLIKALGLNFKTYFILGVMELGITLRQDLYAPYHSRDGKKTNYSPFGAQADYIMNVTPLQLVKGLDKFYEDYRNINIKVLEALDVVHQDIMGGKLEVIDFWTRYYRADESNRSEILKDVPPGVPFKMHN